jgi:hypothetical protein
VKQHRGALYVGLLALMGILLVFFIDPVTPARVGILAIFAILVAVAIEILSRSAKETTALPAPVDTEPTSDVNA